MYFYHLQDITMAKFSNSFIINNLFLLFYFFRASRAYCLSFRNQEADRLLTQAEISRSHALASTIINNIKNQTFIENLIKVGNESFNSDTSLKNT